MKLIRDYLKDQIPEEEWHHITDAVQIRELLKEKLEDELDELAQEEYLSIEKYADVLEVLYELMHWHNIDHREANDVRLAKAHREGSFRTGLVYAPDGLDCRVNKDRGN